MPGRCGRCGRYVGAAEEKLALGKSWHLECFTCAICNTGLDSLTLAEYRELNEIYCKSCYRQFIGPQGYGYGPNGPTLIVYNLPEDFQEDGGDLASNQRSKAWEQPPTRLGKVFMRKKVVPPHYSRAVSKSRERNKQGQLQKSRVSQSAKVTESYKVTSSDNTNNVGRPRTVSTPTIGRSKSQGSGTSLMKSQGSFRNTPPPPPPPPPPPMPSKIASSGSSNRRPWSIVPSPVRSESGNRPPPPPPMPPIGASSGSGNRRALTPVASPIRSGSGNRPPPPPPPPPPPNFRMSKNSQPVVVTSTRSGSNPKLAVSNRSTERQNVASNATRHTSYTGDGGGVQPSAINNADCPPGFYCGGKCVGTPSVPRYLPQQTDSKRIPLGPSFGAIRGVPKGIGERCRRCGRPVFLAELQLGYHGAYHTECFKCCACGKKLDSTSVSEHQGEIFCKGCYRRNFGTHGTGFGIGAGTLQTP